MYSRPIATKQLGLYDWRRDGPAQSWPLCPTVKHSKCLEDVYWYTVYCAMQKSVRCEYILLLITFLIVYFSKFTKRNVSKQIFKKNYNKKFVWLHLGFKTASDHTLPHVHKIRDICRIRLDVWLTNYTKQVSITLNFVCRLKQSLTKTKFSVCV